MRRLLERRVVVSRPGRRLLCLSYSVLASALRGGFCLALVDQHFRLRRQLSGAAGGQ